MSDKQTTVTEADRSADGAESRALRRYQQPEGAVAYADKFRRSRFRARTNRREHRILAEFLASTDAESRLLNVPCGAGRFAGMLQLDERRGTVFGDFSEEMLLQASVQMDSSATVGLEFRRIDVVRDEPRERFDLVLSVRLFHHLKSPEARSRALGFLCRSSTDILVITHASSSTWKGWWRQLRRNLGLRRRGEEIQGPDFMADELGKRGFKIESRRFVDRLFSSQTWLLARRIEND